MQEEGGGEEGQREEREMGSFFGGIQAVDSKTYISLMSIREQGDREEREQGDKKEREQGGGEEGKL